MTNSPSSDDSDNDIDINYRALQTLIFARAAISDPKNWVKNTAAGVRADSGKLLAHVVPDHPKANCWCMLGSLSYALNTLYPKDKGRVGILTAERLFAAIRAETEGYVVISEYNDEKSRTHAEVLSVFDRAIDKMQQEVDKRAVV